MTIEIDFATVGDLNCSRWKAISNPDATNSCADCG